MAALLDDRGLPLEVPIHVEQWALLMEHERLVCLMAARDHGKTITVLAYLAWRLWRHNRDEHGRLMPDLPQGNFEAVYFSATIQLAQERFDRLRQFLTDNAHMFGDLMPTPGAHRAAEFRQVWSTTRIRLRNGASALPKSIGSATRGLHPQVVVADDIVTDRNSFTPLQRGRVWRYLIGTIYPMPGPGGQLIVIGTPQHQQDALHRLRKAPGWIWTKYRAANFDTGQVLWPQRYPITALEEIRATDPLHFAREYQMDPRDDVSSLFPFALTASLLVPGRFMRPFHPSHRRLNEHVLMGADLAVSEEVGADYTVVKVVGYEPATLKRRLIWATRIRGLGFDGMVQLIRDVCRDFSVDIGIIEDNVFQRWLHQHLRRYPETATRIFGHTTGIEKQSVVDGIPGMKLAFQGGLWEVPDGRDPSGNIIDPEAAEYAGVWRSELNAFGYMDGKLMGIGEHDDTVIATWLVERAIRMVEYFKTQQESPDVVWGEDIGIERVKIGRSYS